MRIKRTKARWEIDEINHVVKQYINGRVYAIRFASSMNKADIEASLLRDFPQPKEWLPYNESTNEFLCKW